MWGEEVLLDDTSTLASPTVARCMTYVEVFSISKVALSKVTGAFPEAKRLVRRRAVLVIARRALVRLVKQLRQKRDDGDGRSFMELVLDAANNAGGNLASVVGAEQGGGAYLQLQDEIGCIKDGMEVMRKELSAEMSALRDGVNRLLANDGLPRVEVNAASKAHEATADGGVRGRIDSPRLGLPTLPDA